VAQNRLFTELDRETARANAVREVWGLKSSASEALAQGALAKRSSFLGAAGAALGGIGGAAGAVGSFIGRPPAGTTTGG
jgi:hypothetical protein